MTKITIISTKGQRTREFETSATTWGEFKKEISGYYEVEKYEGIVAGTYQTLNLDEATLPVTNAIIALRPVIAPKSGSYTYSEAREKIKEIKSIISSEEFREFFLDGENGNYTRASTEQLNWMIQVYEDSVVTLEPEDVIHLCTESPQSPTVTVGDATLSALSNGNSYTEIIDLPHVIVRRTISVEVKQGLYVTDNVDVEGLIKKYL